VYIYVYIRVTCISKVQFTYRLIHPVNHFGPLRYIGIEAEVLGSSPWARKNVVFAHALHFAAQPPSGLRLKSKASIM